jgi:hypothetical protein
MKTNFFSPRILTPNGDKGTRSIFAGALLVATALLSACSTISSYDQTAYANATSLKVDTLHLVGQATGSYTDHTKEIAELNPRWTRPTNTIKAGRSIKRHFSFGNNCW